MKFPWINGSAMRNPKGKMQELMSYAEAKNVVQLELALKLAKRESLLADKSKTYSKDEIEYAQDALLGILKDCKDMSKLRGIAKDEEHSVEFRSLALKVSMALSWEIGKQEPLHEKPRGRVWTIN
ncbi:MAG: hypothetical protein PHS02_01645 [Candidatus ainarchaeum sp.]|nr:hypothetical protein [Candidatus ainarchaeum sp.]